MFALLVAVALAQINNEQLASQIDHDGFGLSAGVGGASVAGNLAMLDLRGRLGLQYRSSFEPRDESETPWVRDMAMVTATGSYLALGGQPFADTRLVTAAYSRMLVRRFGLEAGLQYQNNLLLLLEARWTAGLTTRWLLVRTDRLDVSTGVGALVEHEVRNVDPSGPDARLVTNPRVVGRVGWRVDVVPDTLIWRHTAYVEPRADDWHDHLVVDYNTIEARVSPWLSLTGELQLRYDSRPPTDLKRLDTQLTWGGRVVWASDAD